MRKISTFIYQLGQGFLGVIRNSVMSVASMLVLISCMIIIGTFFLIIKNIDYNFKTIDDINIIKIYVPDSLAEEKINSIGEEIDKIGKELGNIEKYEYFTKSQNLAHFKETTDLDKELLDQFTEENNPLPNSYEIHFKGFSEKDFDIDKVYMLLQKIGSIDGVSAENIKENISLYDKVTSVNNTLTVLGVGMMGILLIVSLFVIMNTVKLGLHARRHEIKFMRYCGATKSFIRTPFIIEGVIIGIISAGISFGLQFYIYKYVIAEILTGKTGDILGSSGHTASMQLVAFGEHSGFIMLVFVGIGLFAGIISSSMAIKKHLRA